MSTNDPKETTWYRDEQKAVLFANITALERKVARLIKALEFCKTHNHKDTSNDTHACLGHECRVCDCIDKALKGRG